jgi:hypothetical protein
VWWRHTRGMHGNGPTQGLGAKGTRGERTLNMYCMSLTLEVSKLSGWLKTDPYRACRVEGEGMRFRGEGASWEAGGPGVVEAHKRHARGKGPTQGLGAKGTRWSARGTCGSWS